jgi:DivIVA domain-containing protein
MAISGARVLRARTPTGVAAHLSSHAIRREAPMSVADTEFFAPTGIDDSPHVRFPLTRRGYDPEAVERFLGELTGQMEYLEKELREARTEREAARRNYEKSKEDAYRQLSTRMAELLQAADRHAEKLRVDAEQEANHRVADAMQRAEQILLEAQAEADRNLRHGEDARLRAQTEADRILGGLRESRAKLMSELEALHQRLGGVVGRLSEIVALPEPEIQTAAVGQEPGSNGSRRDRVENPEAEDLLDSVEGFDLILPDLSDADDHPAD